MKKIIFGYEKFKDDGDPIDNCIDYVFKIDRPYVFVKIYTTGMSRKNYDMIVFIFSY